ncbi:MAG: TonB-dependent receptor [Pseudoxanthomonas sp.]
MPTRHPPVVPTLPRRGVMKIQKNALSVAVSHTLRLVPIRGGAVSGAKALLCASAIVWGGPAWAQTAPESETTQPAAQSATQLDSVTVTARRVEESMQDVPVSITALSQETLKERGVNNTFDLQFSSPSLTVSTSQTTGRLAGSYTIRGQKSAADDAPPGVVTYLDEVPVLPYQLGHAMFDLDNVQVLKGPQGTLFGRNTNGGAVLFTSARPRDEFGGYATIRAGNYGESYFESAVNLPLGESAALRVAGNIGRRDGFTDNVSGPDLDNQNYENARVSLRLNGERFNNLTVLSYNYVNELGPGNLMRTLDPCPPAGGLLASCLYAQPLISYPPYSSMGLTDINQEFANQQARGPRGVDNPDPGFARLKAYGISNRTSVNLGDHWTLVNIAGFHDVTYNGLNDYDNTRDTALSVGYSQRNKQFSDELQLQGSFMDGRLNTILGGFWLDYSQDPDGSNATNYGKVLIPFLFDNLQYIHRDETSKAVFGQVSFNATDRLSLTAGYRYTWDEARLNDQQFRIIYPGNVLGVPAVPGGLQVCAFSPPQPGAPGTVDLVTCKRNAGADWGAGTYVLSADWRANDQVMLYAAHHHGYKSGGLNTTSGETVAQFAYDPEKLDDVELGIKSDFQIAGMPTRFNLSGFYDWYDGLQQNAIVLIGNQTASLTQTIGKAELWGAEAELAIVPVTGLTLSGTFGWFDGKYVEGTLIDSTGQLVNLDGQPYLAQRKYTWSLGASYNKQLSMGELNASLFYSWRDKLNTSAGNVAALTVPSNSLLNGRISLGNIAGSGLEVALYGNNLTNETYELGRTGAFGFIGATYGEPRMYGVELTARF